MSSKSDVFGVLGVLGYEIVLFRAQGPCLRRMRLFSRAPNMRGKVLIFAHIIRNFCAACSYLSIYLLEWTCCSRGSSKISQNSCFIFGEMKRMFLCAYRVILTSIPANM